MFGFSCWGHRNVLETKAKHVINQIPFVATCNESEQDIHAINQIPLVPTCDELQPRQTRP